MSNFQLTSKLLDPNVGLHMILGKAMSILATMKYTTFTVENITKDYHSHLRCSLKQVLTNKIKELSNAASTDEKLFWKLLKGQLSSSQMSPFLVDGKLITDKKRIREIWAGHFEELGNPS